MLKKSLTAGVLAVGLVFAGAGAASAHECFIPNRSDQGTAGSANSGNWIPVHISEIYATAHEVVGGEPLTPEQIAQAVALSEEAGIPTSFTIFAKAHLPNGKGVPESHSGDGKGIDHFFSTYVTQLVTIVETVRTS